MLVALIRSRFCRRHKLLEFRRCLELRRDHSRRLPASSTWHLFIQELLSLLESRIPEKELKVVGPVLAWVRLCSRDSLVEDEIEHVVEHLWEQVLYEVIRDAQVGVRVDLDQPCAEVLIHEKIVPVELIQVLLFVRVQVDPDRENRVDDQVLDPRNNVLFEPEVQIWELFAVILLQSLVFERVAHLVEAVPVAVDLEAVVGQMDEIVVFF